MTPSVLGLVLLGLLLKGSGAQFSVTVEESTRIPPGGSANLPCRVGDSYPISSNGVVWYQQRLPGRPRNMVYYVTDAVRGRGPGVPTRFWASVSGRFVNLTIADTLAEDDALYYCVVYDKGQHIFGGGTQLNVLTGETQAPTLSIFPPSLEEVEKNKATVVCLLQDFYPASLDVTWKVDGQIFTNGVEKSRATKQSENNLFMASSYLSLPPMDWSAEKTVTCQVTHQGKTFEKSVKKSECV